MRALEREAKAQRDLFESYLAKYREATARDSIAAAPADARIISRAVVSNIPYFPKKMPIVLIAALGDVLSVDGLCRDRRAAQRRDLSAGVRRSNDAAEPLRCRCALAQSPQPRQRPAAGRADLAACRSSRRRLPPSSAPCRGRDHRRHRRGLAAVGRGRPPHRRDRQRAQRRHDADRDRAGARACRAPPAWCWSIWRFASPNVDVISNDPRRPGIADLVRGHGLVRRHHHPRPRFARASGRGRAGRQRCGRPDAIADALGGGRRAGAELRPSRDRRRRAAGDRARAGCGDRALCGAGRRRYAGRTRSTRSPVRLQSAGFAEVAVLTGPPPALEQAAASVRGMTTRGERGGP